MHAREPAQGTAFSWAAPTPGAARRCAWWRRGQASRSWSSRTRRRRRWPCPGCSCSRSRPPRPCASPTPSSERLRGAARARGRRARSRAAGPQRAWTLVVALHGPLCALLVNIAGHLSARSCWGVRARRVVSLTHSLSWPAAVARPPVRCHACRMCGGRERVGAWCAPCMQGVAGWFHTC